MAVDRKESGCCRSAGTPVTDGPIKGSVGAGGNNHREDVLTIQQMLNAVPPAEGGPVELLDEDGVIGPKTLAAISKYQNKAVGKADGRIDVRGPAIKALMRYLVESSTVPFGKLGAPQQTSSGAAASTNGDDPSDLAEISIAVALICLDVLEPSLNRLRWRLARATTNMMSLMDKHFANRAEMVTAADVDHVRTILGGLHHYLARSNAFGKLPIENVILFDPKPPGTTIAYTVRGGDKMSTSQIQIYQDKDANGKFVNLKLPGQSIWLTSRFAKQPTFEKHWTMLHELAHFVGRRDNPKGGPTPLAINDHASAKDPGFSRLTKFQRLHNAESLSLFFLECCIGTKDISTLPRLSSVKNLYDRFPKVTPAGDIVTS